MTTYYVHCHCMCVHLNSIITSSSFFFRCLVFNWRKKKTIEIILQYQKRVNEILLKFVPFALFYIPICRFVSFFLFGKFRFDIELTFLYIWIESRRTLITWRTINAINFNCRIFRFWIGFYDRFLNGLRDTIFPKWSCSPQMLCYTLNTVIQSLLVVLPLKKWFLFNWFFWKSEVETCEKEWMSTELNKNRLCAIH